MNENVAPSTIFSCTNLTRSNSSGVTSKYVSQSSAVKIRTISSLQMLVASDVEFLVTGRPDMIDLRTSKWVPLPLLELALLAFTTDEIDGVSS